MTDEVVRGRLVLDDQVASGRITVKDGRIASIELEASADDGRPYIAPGFVDVHVHGWGGHDAMGDADALDGMARALLRRGVTSFLPTAVTAPLDSLAAFADRVRAWMPTAPADGAEPLGFNLEGPFLAPAASRRSRGGPPSRTGRSPARDARTAGRRSASPDARPGTSRCHGPHPLAPRPGCGGVGRALCVGCRRRRGTPTPRVPARRPTCSTR